MEVDAKSPQHTAVHPMYVSYSSLPTTLSNASTKIVSPIHNSNSITKHTSNRSHSNNNLHHSPTPNNIDVILKSSLFNHLKSSAAGLQNCNNAASNNSLASAHKFHSYQQYSSNCTGLPPTSNLARNLSFNLRRNDVRYTEVLQQLKADRQTSGGGGGNGSYPRQYQNLNEKLLSDDRSPSPPPVPPRNASQQQLHQLLPAAPVTVVRQFGIENPFEKLNDGSPFQSLNAINENGPYQHDQPLPPPPPMGAHNARPRGPPSAFPPRMSPNISPQHSFVARSPNLNRIARRRLDCGAGVGSNGGGCVIVNGVRHAPNFCDQVRSPTRPLPHVDNNGYAEPYSIHRVKSQDRIVQRQRRHPTSSRNHRDQRPRSYCSTNSNGTGFIEQLC